MAQIKINSSSNDKNGKLKMNVGQKKSPSSTVQFNLGNKEIEEPEIEENSKPANTGMPDPVNTSFDSENNQDTNNSLFEEQADYTVDDKDDLINDEGDDDLGTRKGRKKARNKNKKNRGKKDKKPKDNKPQTVEARYKAYTIRKYVTIGCLVLVTVALIFFGVFNTFFKHTLTEPEAASYTNRLNGQTQVQQWDTGVQGYLQSNLQTILTSNSSLSGNNKEFTVTNISVEKNLQLSSDSLITFFSADITVSGETTRVFFELPLKIVDNKFTQAGTLSMSFREPFASDDSTISENEFLDFGKIKINEEVSSEFEKVLENFLTLGYNEKQDVSNIYKGEAPLDFNGKFTGIVKCEVYQEDNQLGYNTIAIYNIELPNGFKYKTTNLMKIEKQGSSYVITKIL